MKQAEQIEVFDVVLLGFDGGHGESPLEGLQRVFGIDENAAARVLANLPATVQRGVSGVRAAYFVRALSLIGARAETRDKHGASVEPRTRTHADTIVDPEPAGARAGQQRAPTSQMASRAGAGAARAQRTQLQAPPGQADGDKSEPGVARAAHTTQPSVPARGPARTQLAHAPTGNGAVATTTPTDPAPATGGPTGGRPQRTLMWGRGADTDSSQRTSAPASMPTTQGSARPRERAAAAAFGAAQGLGLPRHASTLGKDILEVAAAVDGVGTRRVSLGDPPESIHRSEHPPPAGEVAFEGSAALSAGILAGASNPPSGSGNLAGQALREGWRGLPPPVLDPAEISRRWPRASAARAKHRGERKDAGVTPAIAADAEPDRAAEPPTGLTLGDDRGDLEVMGAWEQPGSATARRYQHPNVPQGKPLASPNDMGAVAGLAPSAGPSYRPGPRSRTQRPTVDVDASFWETIGHGLSLPFMGTGTLWIVGISIWSLVGGVLTAAATHLPNHLVLASLVVLVLASSSLVAFSADFFRACFWAVLEGKNELDRSPTTQPGQFLDQYVIAGFNLVFFTLAAALPVAAWGLWTLRGSGTAEDLIRSPITWGLIALPFAYWPMALCTAAVGHRLGAVWMIGSGLLAIARAPLAYLTVMVLGALAFVFAGAVFIILGSVTGQPWIAMVGAGFPLSIRAGIEGALLGHLVRANPDLFD